MLPKVITENFIKKFYALHGKNASVCIKHLLYGSQKIGRCVLYPFVDRERIGLIINSEDIYITFDELCGVFINDSKCSLKGDVMELSIDVI